MSARRKPAILVVDDEPGVATTLAWVLQQSGYLSAVAHTGKAAVEMAATMAADLVILDVNLPEMDGLTAASQICERLPRCTILLMSGDPDSVHAVESLRIGERKIEVLAKPFEPPELLDAVARLLPPGGRKA